LEKLAKVKIVFIFQLLFKKQPYIKIQEMDKNLWLLAPASKSCAPITFQIWDHFTFEPSPTEMDKWIKILPAISKGL
jgi:hypothetical protein